MNKSSRSHGVSFPRQLNGAMILLGALTVITLVYFVFGLAGYPILANPEALGPQGDFFGGHLASIIGAITLIAVIFTGYLQISHDRKYRLREFLLSGITAMSSYEARQPGTEQAMRLLEYFSMLALEIGDDDLLLILNTVITGAVRARLEEIEKAGLSEYRNAVEARHRIGAILEARYKPPRS